MTSARRLNDTFDTGLVWFRRDLRSTDNAALYYALKHCERVWCVFVFDTTILQPLLDAWQARHPDEQLQDRRIEIHSRRAGANWTTRCAPKAAA